MNTDLNMIIDIKEFVETGCFGPVTIGMSRSNVENILGTPDNDAKLSTGTIIVYSWYEFFFNLDHKLSSIQIDNYDPNDLSTYEYKSDLFEIDPWILRSKRRLTFGEVKDQLTKESMNFKDIDYYGRKAIQLQSEVVIDFDDEPDTIEDRPIIGFRYYPGWLT